MVRFLKKKVGAEWRADLAVARARQREAQKALDELPARRDALLRDGKIDDAAAHSSTGAKADKYRADIDHATIEIAEIERNLADAQQRETNERIASLLADARTHGRAGSRAHETAVAERAHYAAIKAEITRLSPTAGATLPHISPWLLDVSAMNAGRVAMPAEALSFDLLLTEALTRLERKLAA